MGILLDILKYTYSAFCDYKIEMNNYGREIAKNRNTPAWDSQQVWNACPWIANLM